LFKITSAVPSGTNFVVTWKTAGPRTDLVQAANGGLDSGYNTNFHAISSPIVVSVPGDCTTNYTDVGGATSRSARYYRVRLGP
jgi:hypothetical protein